MYSGNLPTKIDEKEYRTIFVENCETAMFVYKIRHVLPSKVTKNGRHCILIKKTKDIK